MAFVFRLLVDIDQLIARLPLRRLNFNAKALLIIFYLLSFALVIVFK